ncbi:MAG: gliding motility-associated C-terminal domain-containing protein [Bacteroidota bacterium]
MKKIFTLSFLFVFSLSFSQTFILPSVGVQSTYCGGCPMGTCSGTLLDPGGAGLYPNNVNQIYQTFCPTTPGNCLRVTFTAFDTELGYDFVTVGNGPAQNSAVFNGAPAAAGGQIWGTPAVPFSYTANNTSGCLTFRFNSDNIINYAGFTASLSCVSCTTAQATGNSDACASTFICSNLGFNDISNGPGLNPTEGCGGSNCVTGENYSNWYTFTAATTGALTFTIDPNVNTEDFDFAVFGPNPVCGSLGAPVRCSYAANSSFTGLGSGAIDNSEDVFGNGWVAPMNVTAGQTYMLMVNNWTAGGAGFNILFGGATLGVLAPVVNSPSVCAGQSAILTATPTTSGGTYTWSPGGLNTQSISVSPGSTTSYSVIYSTGGCTSGASTPATVTVVNLPTANAGSGAALTCAATTAVLSGSGGGTYAWSGPGITGGGTTATPTVNAPGTYSLSVTSAGCTSTVSTVAVTQNTTPPTPTASNSTTLSCSIATAALLGGPASGVTYQWSGPGFSGGTTSQNATATAPGNYTLTVTDVTNGCTGTAVTTVLQNTTAPSPTASNGSILNCANSTVALTGGPGAGVTYQWSGPGFSGGTTSQNATATAPGTYTLVVTNTANSCTAQATTAVTQNTTPPTPTASNSSTLNCANSTVALTGGPGTGVTYQWSGAGFSGGTTSQNATATVAGTYTLVVTSTVNSCTAQATTAVTQNTTTPSPTASNSSTLTCTNTTVPLTGGPGSGVTYQWSGPGFSGGTTSQNAIGTAPGTYTLKVTSTVNSCTAQATTVVSQNITPPSPTASNSTTLTCGVSTVALTGGPASGVSYQWSGPGFTGGTTSQNAIGTASGTYTLKVTDAVTSCTAQATTVVSQNLTPPSPTASNSTTLTCATTTAALTGGPATGVSYQWSGAGFSGSTTSQNATATAPGTYTLIVTSTVNSCTALATTAVIQNTTTPTSVASTTGTLTCTSGSVNLTSTLAGMNYTWTAPAGGSVSSVNTQSTTGSGMSGTYTLAVINPTNSCTYTTTTIVNQNTVAPTGVSAGANTALTCASASVALNGSVTTPTNAAVNWTGASVCGSATSLNSLACGAGTYTLTATNPLNGCTATSTVMVSPSAGAPSVVLTPVTSSLSCTNTLVTVSISSTTTPVSYAWSGPVITSGSTTGTITVSQGGSYSYTVTNTTNSCTTIGNQAVVQNTTVPTTTASTTGTLTCTSSSVNLNSTLAGMNYTWTAPGSGNIGSANTQSTSASGSAGTYSLMVLNSSNGCTFSTTTSVAQNTVAPTGLNAGTNQTLTCASTSVTLNGSITTPTNATIGWAGAGVCGTSTSLSSAACSAGVYTLTATDAANGCVSTSTVEIFPNAGAPTASISSTALIIDCFNTTQSVTVTSTPNTDVTYTWNTPPLSVSASGDMATFDSPNTYICTVTNTISNCSTPVQVVVTTNTTAPTATISVSGILTCSVTSVTLTGTSTPTNVTYLWNTGATTPVISVSVPGPCTLTIVDPVNGCTNTAISSVIQNTVTPTGVSAGTSQTLTCASPSIALNGSVATPTNATISWTGASVCGPATALSSAACSAGIYTLTVTDPSNGCTIASTVDIAPNAGAPTATITSTALAINCNNATQSVTVTSTPNTDVTYTWNVPPATISVNGDMATFNSPNTYICTVTNTLSNCSTPVQVIVTTNTTIPSVSITGTQTLTCAAPTAVISTTTNPTSGITYTWTGALVSGQGTGVVTVNTAGDYSVTVLDAANGCTNTSTSHIDADTNIPVVSISATSTNSVITCASAAVVLVATTTPTAATYSYTWSPSGNTGSSSETATAAGVYNVVVLNAATGCTATAISGFTVNGNTIHPTVATSNTTIPCGSPSVSIGATSTNVTFSWATSNGTILSGATTSNPIAGSAGDYVVTVTDNVSGCTNTSTITVTSVAVTAAFTANPTSGTAPLLVNFTNQTPGVGNVYSWNFGDDNNNTSTLTNPDHTYNSTGTYTVLLVVSNGGGCTATATLSIDVFENSSIIVPNVFTPNGDGKNDIFRITTTGIKDLNCDIFNRWGTKVANISGVNGTWDGSNVNDGTFFFILTATGFDATEYKQQGYINIFK